MKYYSLNIAGLQRLLPLISVSRRTQLATFSILGDVELVDRLADTFTEKFRLIEFDYMLCPAVRVMSLVHGITKRLNMPRFVVCRGSVKRYMVDPTVLQPLPSFPRHVKPIVINGRDREFLKGKKVIIVDDVVSTGANLRMANMLMEKIGATVVLSAAVVQQGSLLQYPLSNFFTLVQLPLFKRDIDIAS